MDTKRYTKQAAVCFAPICSECRTVAEPTSDAATKFVVVAYEHAGSILALCPRCAEQQLSQLAAVLTGSALGVATTPAGRLLVEAQGAVAHAARELVELVDGDVRNVPALVHEILDAPLKRWTVSTEVFLSTAGV